VSLSGPLLLQVLLLIQGHVNQLAAIGITLLLP
jgi:hypothetical protein